MANVIKTVMTYPLNGTQTEFDIPFDYLARKFVVVTLIGVDRKVLVLNTDYRFPTKTKIQTTKAWGPGDNYQQIEIRRFTSATERLVDFQDGSILRAYDLNVGNLQTTHIAEEARDLTADTIGVNNDGNLDARGRKIVNVGDGVDPGDAVSFGQVTRWSQSALNSANAAKVSENAAKASEGNALSYRNGAQTARDEAYQARSDAMVYRDAAKLSQTESKTSENNASNSANSATAASTTAANHVVAAFEWGNRAEDSLYSYSGNTGYSALHYSKKAEDFADKAKTEADKLGNMNLFASQVASVDDTTGNTGNVTFKGSVYTQGGLGTLATDDKAILGFYNGGYATRWGYMGFGDPTSASIFFVNDRQQSSDAFQFKGGVVAPAVRAGDMTFDVSAQNPEAIPGVQNRVARFFGRVNPNGTVSNTTPGINVSKGAAGQYIFTFAGTPFGGPNYIVLLTMFGGPNTYGFITVIDQSTTGFRVYVRSSSTALVDAGFDFIVLG